MKHEFAIQIPQSQVRIEDAFWTVRRAVNRSVTIPHEYEMCRVTGRLEALKLAWRPGDVPVPHIFWESDVAKWIEAASYTLIDQPDPQIDDLLDQVVALLASAQQPDGYLNVYYTVVEPDKRFTNLRDCHELYCAGHLIEAGVAHHDATGKRTLLDVVCRYADLIGRVFGTGANQIPGYCGHEEIELALVKLYHATGNRSYLELSRTFIDQRGRQPHYFDEEARRRGDGDTGSHIKREYSYCQAHKPVREQTQVTGHAVRAMYLYAGMADLARELDDRTLVDACERLWNHLCQKQLYLTGGIGATRANEGFLDDYNLPDDTAYCETCAGIGLVFWAQRMLRLKCDRAYADVLERALYNNVLAGSSLDGKSFFYDNPLASYASQKNRQGQLGDGLFYDQRSTWFGCACCPPNYARLISSLGGYVYTQTADRVAVHLYLGGSARLSVGGRAVELKQETRYPWDGRIKITVTPEQALAWTLALRIPAWCSSFAVTVNGQTWPAATDRVELERGYLPLRRTWQIGDILELTLDMPVCRVYAHPDIRQYQNRVAIQRGPLVYCAEQADNTAPVRRIYLPENGVLTPEYNPDLLGGVVCLQAEALAAAPDRAMAESDGAGALYGRPPEMMRCRLTLIPYYAWNNRQPGEMRVWLPVWGHVE